VSRVWDFTESWNGFKGSSSFVFGIVFLEESFIEEIYVAEIWV
jgi:hypothetical protein